MKTHLLCAIALGLAGAATAASAQDSTTFNVNSSVTPFCSSLTAPTGTLELGDLVDDNGEVVDAFANSPTYSVSGYYCNAPAKITLAAAPLMQTEAPLDYNVAGFTNRVDYEAVLAWGAVDGSDESAGEPEPAEIDSGTANMGNLVLSVTGPNTDGNRRPLSGAYEGSVTLTIALN